MSTSERIVVKTPGEFMDVIQTSYLNPEPALRENLFKPAIQDCYMKEFVMQKRHEGDKVIFDGMSFGTRRTVIYGENTITLVSYFSEKNTATKNWLDQTIVFEDQELATYFINLLRGVVPPFSERVFNYCFFILSLYLTEEYQQFREVEGHVWHEYYDSGNVIKIDGFYCMWVQRKLLSAGTQWVKVSRIRHIFYPLIPVTDIQNLILDYAALSGEAN